jgi:hypothetical protein
LRRLARRPATTGVAGRISVGPVAGVDGWDRSSAKEDQSTEVESGDVEPSDVSGDAEASEVEPSKAESNDVSANEMPAGMAEVDVKADAEADATRLGSTLLARAANSATRWDRALPSSIALNRF